MNFHSLQTSADINFDLLLNKLKNAALTRDFQMFKAVLSPFLNTDLSNHSLTERAYLNYYLGYFHIHFGKSKNKREYQEIGKDYLTNAVEQFQQLGLQNEIIEARISLGSAYFHTGVIDNYEIFLQEALADCDSKTSDAFFSVNVSLLVVFFQNQKIKEALDLIVHLENKIHFCSNGRIKCQFFHNSARIFRLTGNFPKAFYFYQEAIKIAKQLNNQQFEAITLNSFAYCCLVFKEYELGLDLINKSIDIFKFIKNEGGMAEALDTKSLIYKATGKLEEALKTINAALTYFRLGENYLVFAEVLWNKIEICQTMQKKYEIIATFAELGKLALDHLEPEKRLEYYEKFSDLMILPFGETFRKKMENCRTSIISPVLEQSDGVVDAARKLGVKHQTINYFLKKHPHLKPEHFSMTETRVDKHEIWKIKLSKKANLPGLVDVNSFGFFQCDSIIAERFHEKGELILMVSQNEPFQHEDLVLLKNRSPFIAEFIIEDDFCYFIDERGITIPKDKETRCLGRIVGYAKVTEHNSELEFKPVYKNCGIF